MRAELVDIELEEVWVRIYNVWMSVARPVKPRRILSCILKTFWKLVEMVGKPTPSLLSVPIATHLSPAIATMAPPVYEKISICLYLSLELLKIFVYIEYSINKNKYFAAWLRILGWGWANDWKYVAIWAWLWMKMISCRFLWGIMCLEWWNSLFFLNSD